MADINIGRAPGNHIVLPFFGTGALFYLVLSILLLLSTNDWNGHYFTPHLLGIVHTAALGWGAMIIFGAAYQLLPVICERDLYSPRMAQLSFFTLVVGICCLIPAFWTFRPGWIMLTGGSLVVCAAILYTINAVYTAGTCTRYSIQRLFILSSAGWLLLTTIAGLLLVINLGRPFIFRSHLDLLKLHAHAGLAGWFLQLITGVSTKLVPMFLLGKSTKSRLLYISIILQNTGLLLFIIDGLIGIPDASPLQGHLSGTSAPHGLLHQPFPRTLLYAALVAAGIISWLRWLADVYKHRARKNTDWPMKQVLLSFISLLLAILLIPLMHYSSHPKWVLVYGLFIFLGWISTIILGMTFKTLPFIVWNGRYKNLNGKIKVPMPKHLYKENWVRYQSMTHITGVLLLILGVILQQPIIIRLSLWINLITAAIFITNVLRILFHKANIPAHETVHT